MNKHFLIIDGNSLGHQANEAGVLRIGTMQTQAVFHFLRMLRSYVGKFSFATPIVLWDGISWRKDVFPEYKENRKREASKHDLARKEARLHYQRQLPHIQKALSFLGVTQIKADNMEADDLAAILSKLYASQGHKIILLSEDKDWIQLVSDRVSLERPRSKDRITLANLEEKTGCKTPAQFIDMKALMGDGGDNIAGVGGVGDKRAVEFLAEHGSFNQFLNDVTLNMIDLKKLPKWKRDLVDDETKAFIFASNIRLVDLNTTARPAPNNMVVMRGQPSAENFRKLCDLLLFKSFTDNFDNWLSVFPVSQTLVAA